MSTERNYTTIEVENGNIHVIVKHDRISLKSANYRRTGKALAGILTPNDLKKEDPIQAWIKRTKKHVL